MMDRGKFDQDASVTPPIFNDHRESGPWFNILSEGWQCPYHYTGALGPIQTTS